MPSEKFFVHKEDGSLVRLKGRLVRFLDEEPPTGSDKSAIRTALEVSPDAEGLVQADVGTDPNQLVLHQHLGDISYQSADSVSVDELEVTDKIGIGTNSGSRELTIGDGTGSPNMQLLSSNSGLARIEFGDTDDGDAGELMYDHSNNKLTVNTAGSTAVTIDSSQRVGIGGSPTRKLELKKTGFLGSSTLGSPTDSTVSIDVRGNASTDIVQGEVLGAYTLDAYDSSTATGGGVTQNSGMHFVAGNHFGPSASSVDLVFATGANGSTAERWRIDANTGNLVANSTGIDFGSVAGGTGTPATDAGLLNDFERGSFTPSFTSTGTAPTLTYLAQVGTYTKVGNLVTCHGRVRVNAVTGAGTGSLQISGLPFATQNVSNLGSGGSVCLAAFFGTSSSGCPTHISGGNNATVMTLKTLKNSAGVVASLDNTDAADLAGNCYVDFSVTYTTA